MISIIGGTALLAALLFLGLTLRKNTTVYKATGKGNEYEKMRPASSEGQESRAAY